MQEYQVKVYDDRTEWFQNGVLHRIHGPAIEWKSGLKEWLQKGKLHRDDGPAMICRDGSQYWYQNGIWHRDDGPALEYANGTKAWYKNRQLHRLDGPAIEYANGCKSWYLYGKQYTEEEFNAKMNPKSSDNIEGKIVEIKGKKYKLTAVKNT